MGKIDMAQGKKEKIHMKGKTEIKFAPPKCQKIYWGKKLNGEAGTCGSIRKISVLHY